MKINLNYFAYDWYYFELLLENKRENGLNKLSDM